MGPLQASLQIEWFQYLTRWGVVTIFHGSFELAAHLRTKSSYLWSSRRHGPLRNPRGNPKSILLPNIVTPRRNLQGNYTTPTPPTHPSLALRLIPLPF